MLEHADLTGFKRIGGGKTKDIFEDKEPGKVIVRSRDDITAGDGARRDSMTGKAVLSTTMTVNNFKYLEHQNIPTHFLEQLDPTSFIAKKCTPIPIECVARRFVAGSSFPKRVPFIPEGFRFDNPLVEFFWKEDTGQHTDPFMDYDVRLGLILLHPAKEPTTDNNVISAMNPSSIPGVQQFAGTALDLLCEMENETEYAFRHLEEAYDRVGLTLVDFKIEFGVDEDGRLLIIDVIDADSWRAWVDGDPQKAVDKEYFRQHPDEPADTSLPAFRLVAEKSQEIVYSL